jgi:hypothetical protein
MIITLSEIRRVEDPPRSLSQNYKNQRIVKIKTFKRHWIPAFAGMTVGKKLVMRQTPRRGGLIK